MNQLSQVWFLFFLGACKRLYNSLCWLVAPLVGPLVGLLVRWSVGPLARWSVGPLVRWSVGPLVRWLVCWSVGLSLYHFECIFSYSEIGCLLSLEQRYFVVKFRSCNNKRAILLLIWNYFVMRLVWIILVYSISSYKKTKTKGVSKISKIHS
jgi:hypothetical protein